MRIHFTILAYLLRHFYVEHSIGTFINLVVKKNHYQHH